MCACFKLIFINKTDSLKPIKTSFLIPKRKYTEGVIAH
jgi:hypothetical protein